MEVVVSHELLLPLILVLRLPPIVLLPPLRIVVVVVALLLPLLLVLPVVPVVYVVLVVLVVVVVLVVLVVLVMVLVVALALLRLARLRWPTLLRPASCTSCPLALVHVLTRRDLARRLRGQPRAARSLTRRSLAQGKHKAPDRRQD